MRYLLYILLLISNKALAQSAPVTIKIDSATTCKHYDHLILLQSTYTNNTADTLYLVRLKTEKATFTYSTPDAADLQHQRDNIIIVDSVPTRLLNTYHYIDTRSSNTIPEILECYAIVETANKKVPIKTIAGRQCFVLAPHTSLHLNTSIRTLEEDNVAFKNFSDEDRSKAYITLKCNLAYYTQSQKFTETSISPTQSPQLSNEIRKQMKWH
jgi:hypothetical protein